MTAQWTAFYQAMADGIAPYSTRQDELYAKIEKLAQSTPLMAYLHFEKKDFWQQRDFAIDPFTTMAIFNRGVTDAHRIELAQKLAALLGVELEPPRVFHGIPHLDPRNSIYAGNDELWRLFLSAIGNGTGESFQTAFDSAVGIRGNAAGMLSIGLFWMRPDLYMPIDRISAPLIEKRYGLKLSGDGRDYPQFNARLGARCNDDGISFPQLAFEAWQSFHKNRW